MLRIALGVIVGFVVWSIVWVGSDSVLQQLSPDWLGKYALAAERALQNGEPVIHDPAAGAVHLLRSFVTSLIAGYLAVLVSAEFKRTTIILGLALLAVGVAVEAANWRIAPTWYHIIFLLGLIPVTMLGGWFRRPEQV